MNKISEETKQQVINLKKEGKTYDQIIELVNISKGAISTICKEANLGRTIKVPIELTPEKIQECQQLYDEIGNIKKVAKQTGISYDRLRNVIVSQTITPKNSYDCVKTRRANTKEKLIKYKGGKCEICGYDKCNQALEFHHVNPEEKSFTISQSNIYKNLTILKQEVDKCILVCANCHREIHAGVTQV